MAIPVPRPPASDLDPDAIYLVVEGEQERQIVSAVLEAAGYPLDRIEVVVATGRYGVAREVADLADRAPDRCAVLVDVDERSLPEARTRARSQLGDPQAEVFCAVPSVEAWLFADDGAVVANARPEEDVRRIVRRLSLPEEIPDPKQLAQKVLGPPARWGFLSSIDIGRAAARSPSLRNFLEGMGRLLGVPAETLFERVGRHLTRDVVAGLIREVSPADTTVWRTSNGDDYTAAELQRLIEEGDPIGRQYASDLLRISRDFLRRTANRPPLMHPDAAPPILLP
ncbi:MAG TPA: hypothetical protein VF173_19205 [Thermoanaerobaculia bacterium]|nr:hypothetical protein [Thermoanaerobaculia bacterium]